MCTGFSHTNYFILAAFGWGKSQSEAIKHTAQQQMKLNASSENDYLGNEIWASHACIHAGNKLNGGRQKKKKVIRKSAMETVVQHSVTIKWNLSLRWENKRFITVFYNSRNKVAQQEIHISLSLDYRKHTGFWADH